MRRIKIGEILVEQGVLSREQVERIREEQLRCARPFGDLAERMFGIDPQAVENAWVTQYVGTVGESDLDAIRIDPKCLPMLSARQAWQFHLLPLNRADGELAMATDEKNVVRALNFATRSIDEVVHLLIADWRQLREVLMTHYPVPREIADYAERLARTA